MKNKFTKSNVFLLIVTVLLIFEAVFDTINSNTVWAILLWSTALMDAFILGGDFLSR